RFRQRSRDLPLYFLERRRRVYLEHVQAGIPPKHRSAAVAAPRMALGQIANKIDHGPTRSLEADRLAGHPRDVPETRDRQVLGRSRMLDEQAYEEQLVPDFDVDPVTRSQHARF